MGMKASLVLIGQEQAGLINLGSRLGRFTDASFVSMTTTFTPVSNQSAGLRLVLTGMGGRECA